MKFDEEFTEFAPLRTDIFSKFLIPDEKLCRRVDLFELKPNKTGAQSLIFEIK